MKKNLLLIVIPSLLLILVSCEAYYFTRPQPIDRSNLKHFPSSLRGTWQSENDNLRIIDKKGIRMILDDTGSQDISKRWVETITDEAGNKIAEHVQFISYDSTKMKYDTSLEIILQGGLAFGVDMDHQLEIGYPYEIRDSVLYYKNKDTIFYDLGNNIVLRKIDKNHYALNIRNTIIGKDNSWWQLVILEKIDKHHAAYYYGLKEHPKKSDDPPFEQIYQKGGDYYLNPSWTALELLKILERDGFDRADSLWRIIQSRGINQVTH